MTIAVTQQDAVMLRALLDRACACSRRAEPRSRDAWRWAQLITDLERAQRGELDAGSVIFRASRMFGEP